MSWLIGNIKSILTIKSKPRHDNYTDQYTRIFMVKIFLVSSFIMGVTWFHDSITCMVPKGSQLSEKFVHSVCWIQGTYTL